MGAKDVVVRHEFERCVLFSEAHMQAVRVVRNGGGGDRLVHGGDTRMLPPQPSTPPSRKLARPQVEAAFPGHSLSSFALDGLLVLQPAQSFATDSEGLSAVAAAASKPWVPLERDDRFVPAPEQTADQSSNVAVLSVAGLALEFYLKLPVPAAGGGEEGEWQARATSCGGCACSPPTHSLTTHVCVSPAPPSHMGGDSCLCTHPCSRHYVRHGARGLGEHEGDALHRRITERGGDAGGQQRHRLACGLRAQRRRHLWRLPQGGHRHAWWCADAAGGRGDDAWARAQRG